VIRSFVRNLVLATVGCALVATAVHAAPGLITLPTAWHIRGADGPVATVGTLPAGIVLSRDGARVFELEAGYRKPMLRVLDAASLEPVSTVTLAGGFGMPLRDPDGDGVWINVPGPEKDELAHVDTVRGAVDRTVPLTQPFYPVAVARAPDGTLAIAGDLADSVAFVAPGTAAVGASVAVGSHPAALAFAANGASLYVAGRGTSQLDVIDVAKHAVRGHIDVGLHPAALALGATRLYVADSDDDDVAVVDLANERVIARARLPFARDDAVGASPNGLALDGDRLYVTCGAANAVAVFRTTAEGIAPLGAMPTGWYPTAVAVDRGRGVLYVADGKGESGHPNIGYATPRPGRAVLNTTHYIAEQLTGSIRRIAIPDDAALARGVADVRELAQHETATPSTILRAGGPIRHIVYVIKENRSYDQVLGDMQGADGDPSLVLFGSAVTPNQHELARRFGTFDRFFANAHVSADGHNWAAAAFANDYVEKMWPATYANRRPVYDYEDSVPAAVPHGRFLWNVAVAHGITVRNYGERVNVGPPVTVPDDMRPFTDLAFAGFDMKVSDVDRVAQWKREFDAYVRSDSFPQLEILRLPRDHTSGTGPNLPTPSAMVADNDLAVGKLVEAISHSRYWASTAIFAIEDDAQAGPDHVDEQRSTLYIASPYAAGGVQHAMYTQASVLRTIEILLGLPPMSPYDAGALPLTAAFRATPNLRPFDAVHPHVDLNATNAKTAYRAADSARLDFAQADRADDGELNDILWHAVKGAHATPPPYGLFRR
jgi:DNA-binding beta-propeller fold protein YncE